MQARSAVLLAAVALLTACSPSAVARPVAPEPGRQVLVPEAAPSAAPAPAPAPALPAWYIESLKARKPVAGKIQVGGVMFQGQGFTKYEISWPSGGQTMTGTLSLPAGGGPFPVLIVNHGHIPTDRYWEGQDSGIFGDPLASDGFISLAPNYPGYLSSGPGEPGLSTAEQIAVIDQDLISSLDSLPQADAGRVACIGHSQGGGVCQLLMVVEPRLKAVVLHAPVSSGAPGGASRFAPRGPGASPGPAGASGSPGAVPDAHASPANYFAAGQPPVLLVQGTVDHTIPSADTQATYDALQKAGVKSQLLWIPGGDHDLVGSNLATAVGAEETWIKSAFGI